MSIACKEDKTLKVEFLAFVKESQAQVEAHTALATVTGT